MIVGTELAEGEYKIQPQELTNGMGCSGKQPPSNLASCMA